MFRLILLIGIFIFTTSCKQEVGFTPVKSTPLVTPENQAVGIEEPQPEPDPIEPTPVEPPSVRILERPKSHLEGKSTSVEFEIVQGTYPVKKVECLVGSFRLPCGQQLTWVPLVDFLLGDYQVTIKVVDELGLIGLAEAEWSVYSRFVETVNEVAVEPWSREADILFVIDNSGSMAEEQLQVAKRISHFFSKIQDLDWRVGIITTDPYPRVPSNQKPNPQADGSLLPFPNGDYYIESKLKLSEARKLFAKTIRRKEGGNGHERGIRNTYRAVERALNPITVADQRLSSFFRERASFSVVLISDENETLLDGLGNALPEQEKSVGQNLVTFIKNSWGENKVFQFNSVIILPGDRKCVGINEKHGTAYAKLSELTGGVVEDICAKDYTGALKKIGAGVVDLQKNYKLDCVPQDVDLDGHLDVEVVSQKGLSVPSFIVKGDQILFEEPLVGGDYVFQYFCPNSVPN